MIGEDVVREQHQCIYYLIEIYYGATARRRLYVDRVPPTRLGVSLVMPSRCHAARLCAAAFSAMPEPPVAAQLYSTLSLLPR